ncbi:hypothetical protein AB0D78_45240 [Streptomyces avermitilis]|uniref:hypothetical protein n=1 Tax=Streptomyces avermitilis TaxID=33903 RepID=UPI0033FEA26F
MITPRTPAASAPPRLTVPEDTFTDSSCYHAALGTLLVEHDSGAEPELTLGNTVATRAHKAERGPVFGDLVPALLTSMAARGHRVERRRITDDGARQGLIDALRGGAAVVVVVDTFYLDHYWVDRGRVHALHALTVRDFRPSDGTVRLVDAVDLVFADDRVPLSRLEPALLASDIGQSWLRITEWGTDEAAADAGSAEELTAHADVLAGQGTDELSGVELALWTRDSLDELFALTPRLAKPEARSGTDDERRLVTRLMRGMWNYHHTLRWFARYLRAVPAGSTASRTAPAVERASQDWLAARSMLLHSGLANPARTARYRDEVARRLDRVAGDLRAAGDLIGVHPEGPE